MAQFNTGFSNQNGHERTRHLSVCEAAQYLGVSKSYLNKLRTKGNGPEFFKIGARVTYAVEDLDAWLNRHRRRSTSDPGSVGQRAANASNEENLSGAVHAMLTPLDRQGKQMSGEHQIYSENQRIGRVTEQKNKGWAAFDQDDRPLGIFPDESKAVGAVLVTSKERKSPSIK